MLSLAGTAVAGSKHQAEAEEADRFFSVTNTARIVIQMDDADYNVLREYSWNPQAASQRPEVKVEVREGGQIYRDVALHPKGSFGSSRPITERPALTLTFDKFVSGQRFHGLSKISLNNSAQDPSYLRESLCRELFNEIGVPTPRVGRALVTLNGVHRGFYLVLEGADKRFLRSHFSDASGTLYDGGYARDIGQPLDITSGDKSGDREDLAKLAAAARISDPGHRYEALAKLVDLDRFSKMMAVEALVAHYDGYSQNRNNYRIYHDPESGRLVFIPHGMDLILLEKKIQNPLISRYKGMVSNALITTPQGRARHLSLLREYATNLCSADGLLARLDRLQAGVEHGMAELEEDRQEGQARMLNRGRPRQGYRDAAQDLRQIVRLRCDYIQDRLDQLEIRKGAGPGQ